MEPLVVWVNVTSPMSGPAGNWHSILALRRLPSGVTARNLQTPLLDSIWSVAIRTFSSAGSLLSPLHGAFCVKLPSSCYGKEAARYGNDEVCEQRINRFHSRTLGFSSDRRQPKGIPPAAQRYPGGREALILRGSKRARNIACAHRRRPAVALVLA